MKIVVTRKELQLYVDFEGWLRESPCINCSYKGTCCGCQQNTAQSGRKPEGLSYKEYEDSGVLKAYAKAAQEYAEASKAKTAAVEVLDKARNRYDEILEQFTVEEESE